jgi:hypothetical protein
MFAMRVAVARITMSLALALAACGSDGSSVEGATTGDAAGTTEQGPAITGGEDVATDTSAVDSEAPSDGDADAESDGVDGTGADNDDGASSTGAPADETEGDAGTEPPEGALFYEPFDGPDGESWSEPWTDVGGLIASEIDGGRGRLQGMATTVGRMVFPGIDALDVDATATVVFEDWWHQGFGLYVRQNGGYLVSTDPPGQGYALYVEGGYMQLLGVWRERDGVEEIIAGETVDGGFLESGVEYRARFRCTQEGPETRLQAKIWPASEPEPDAWQVDVLDATPELQNVGGTLAVDIYNYQGTASILVDDITLMPAR